MQTREQLANELLNLESVERRAQRAIRQIIEEIRWRASTPDPQASERLEQRIKRRIASPTLRDSHSEYLVVNSQGRSVFATSSKALAIDMANNRYGRKVLNMSALSPERRELIGNRLRSNLGRLKAISPVIPLPSLPSERPPADPNAKINQLLSDVRAEVAALHLPLRKYQLVLDAASHVALHSGWRDASDFIFEVKLLGYTNVQDTETKETFEFPSRDDAADACTQWNLQDTGLVCNKKGQPLRLRFKLVNPNLTERETYVP